MHALYPESQLIKSVTELIECFYFRIGSACVVFGNLENEDELKTVICNNHQAHIVVTSRYTEWHLPKIQLHSFNAQQLLNYATNNKIGITNSEAEDLNGLLEGLPLAITQAFAYIQQNSQVSVAEYCDNYKKDREHILTEKNNK